MTKRSSGQSGLRQSAQQRRVVIWEVGLGSDRVDDAAITACSLSDRGSQDVSAESRVHVPTRKQVSAP